MEETMASIFEEKTVEEAIQKASKALDIPKNKLNVEVLSYGSTGIFGLVGIKKARIRVQPKLEHKTGYHKEKREKPPQEKLPQENLLQEKAPQEHPPQKNLKETDTDTPDIPQPPLEEIEAFAKDNLAYVLDKVVDHSVITSTIENEGVTLQVESENSALLIGKHGQTIDALQYLLQRMVHKKYPGRVPVILDIENYRNRREASLTSLALRLAEKVKHSGKPATIRPMNAYERRIVHLVLQPVREVTSRSSRGAGHLKKMTIFPKNSRSSRNKNAATKKPANKASGPATSSVPATSPDPAKAPECNTSL